MRIVRPPVNICGSEKEHPRVVSRAYRLHLAPKRLSVVSMDTSRSLTATVHGRLSHGHHRWVDATNLDGGLTARQYGCEHTLFYMSYMPITALFHISGTQFNASIVGIIF